MKTLLLILAALLALPVLADDGDHYYSTSNLHPDRRLDLWQKECGSCHMAYPPGLLPAAAWRKMMSRLDKHFGADASLSANEQGELTDFLVKHAGSARRVGSEVIRITETPHFVKEHRKIAESVWERASIKSAANCQACHLRAAEGDFSERQIRIPR
ncbi:MAG: diheme cytochrome c [Betaproteobacteria bacterium]|nr:diheme cytochrome c [Betaproteobacteria bacterium]